MKQVINGKMYNTDTAIEIGSWNNGLGYNDFRNCDESLYKTKNGRYFLAGHGGPMSKYARPAGNMTSGGSGIDPVSEKDARLWCETHDIDADIIEKYFQIEEA